MFINIEIVGGERPNGNGVNSGETVVNTNHILLVESIHKPTNPEVEAEKYSSRIIMVTGDVLYIDKPVDAVHALIRPKNRDSRT